jgi:hypothetical protein
LKGNKENKEANRRKAPDMKLVDTKFSGKVQSMKGPKRCEELAKCEEFDNKIVTSISNEFTLIFY